MALKDALRGVVTSLAHPLVPEDYLDLFHPLRAGAPLRARIVAIQRETSDAATVVLKPSKAWAGHRPGQYIRIGIDVDGVRQWRAYSLTHVEGALLSITVKAIPEGRVSNHLVRHALPGAIVELDQAAGDFVLPEETPEKLLFVTAGSGVTPVMGMLRNHDLADVTVVHINRTPQDAIFRDELLALHDAGRISLVEHNDCDHGIFDVHALAELVPDVHARTIYGCGPVGLLDALEEYAEGNDLTLHTERFRPSVVEPGEGGTVVFRDGTSVDADGATTILDAAEVAGVLMPSGCRMGMCFGCVLPLKDGAVRDLRTGEVTSVDPMESDAGGVPIQTCVSSPAGACHLDH